jgi:hypothetical protein
MTKKWYRVLTHSNQIYELDVERETAKTIFVSKVRGMFERSVKDYNEGIHSPPVRYGKGNSSYYSTFDSYRAAANEIEQRLKTGINSAEAFAMDGRTRLAAFRADETRMMDKDLPI